ncbi:MAG: putative Ig domain-containing protein [Bryobacteraceae bacterium]
MRYVYTAVIGLALSALVPCSVFGEEPPFSIPPVDSSYTLVGQTRNSLTKFSYTYQATLVNAGPAVSNLTATLTSLASSVTVVAGQGTLQFASVPANGNATSTNTFTITVDRSAAFAWTDLQWTFDAPVANPGVNQTVSVGSTVTLNGTGSTNPGGIGSLTYAWTLLSVPNGSAALSTLSNANMATATFTADVYGTYTAQLTVSNGVVSNSATVTITTSDSAPTAMAGQAQTVVAGTTVMLNGSGSSDVNGHSLTYAWSFVSYPGTMPTLNNPTSVNPTFLAGVAGTYIIELIVNDGTLSSTASTVTVTTTKVPPVANAGMNQTVVEGSMVQLDGSGSTQANGDMLTYSWSLNTPSGSMATLSSTSAVKPTFTADVTGTYVAQLIVYDGTTPSQPATVTISTILVLAPTANPGTAQGTIPGVTVTLNGSGSSDPQGLPLTYSWSILMRPATSGATLSAANIINPTFVSDVPGTYVVQLIVNNGYLSSSPMTVTISTTEIAPVAHPGINRGVSVGAQVTLDGAQSYDPEGMPLIYAWSFLSIPAGSNASLSGANTASPTFTADVTGIYVAQLIVSDFFASSVPATVTITAGSLTITLSPNPDTIYNSPATLTVTLSPGAGASPITVNLSGFDPTILSVPSTVTVAANSSSQNFTITPVMPGTVEVNANATGYQQGSTAVTVESPSVSIALNNNATAVGLSQTVGGTITLSAPAPPSPSTGTIVALSVFQGPGQVTFNPPSVTILPGNSTGTFSLTGASLGSTTINATATNYITGTKVVQVATLTLSCSAVTSGEVGVPFSSPALTANGGTAPYTFSVATGTLPAGLTLTASSGAITGTPTGSGTFAIGVTDANGVVGGSTCSITIASGPSIACPNAGAGEVGQAFTSPALTVNGGVGPSFTFSVATGTFPAGLTLNASTGAITGTPTSSGTFTLKVTDANGVTSGPSCPFTVAATLSLACPAATTGEINVAFNTAVTASGGVAPLTFSLANGSLPAGLSLNASTGAITGTPTAPGNFTVEVTDSKGAVATTTCFFTIVAAPTLSYPASQGEVGAALNSPPTVIGGVGPFTFSVASGALPSGVSLNTSTGAVTGTPGAPGGFTVQVKDANLATATSGSFSIVAGLMITCSAVTTGEVNVAFNSPAPTTSGGVAPLTFSVAPGTLPTGLTLTASTGAITGTPTTSGTFIIQAKDAIGVTAATSCSITIAGGPSISCPAVSTGEVGFAFSSSVSASGGTGPGTYTFSVATGALPAGLSLNASTGAITGTPTATGAFTVQVKDANQVTATTTCSITISAGPAITCPAATTGEINVPFNSPALTVTGGVGTYTFSVASGSLPFGLTLNTSTGAITGTPQGTGTFTLKVTDSNSITSLPSCAFTIAAAPTVPCPAVSGEVGAAFNSSAIVPAGGVGPFTFTVASGSTLPAGLTLNASTGAITGTPTASGSFTIQATDSKGVTATPSCAFAVAAGPTLTCPGISSFTAGSAVNSPSITVTGGTSPFVFSIGSGTLPTGLTLNTSTGALNGTPMAGGVFTVVVTDGKGVVSSPSCSFTVISPNVTILTTSLPPAMAGTYYTFTPSVSGGVPPYTYTYTGINNGLAYSSTTGTITGIPKYPGNLSVTLTVSDSTMPTPQTAGPVTLPFTITAAPLAFTTTSPLTNATIGTLYTVLITASGGVAPLQLSSNISQVPSLASWLTFDPTGNTCPGYNLCGTPSAMNIGTYSFNVTVMDSTSAMLTMAFMVTVTQGGSVGTLPAVQNVTVGQGLETSFVIGFSPFPTFGVSSSQGCVNSSTPGCLTISTNSGSVLIGSQAGGVTQLILPIESETTSVQALLEAVGPVGSTATITWSAPGYATNTLTATIGNSGFVIFTPPGGVPGTTVGETNIGGSISTYQGSSTTLNVYSALLDANGMYVAPQPVITGTTVTVPITVSPSTPAVLGTLSPASLQFTGATDELTTTFQAGSTFSGSGTVSLTQPSNFVGPTIGGSLNVYVQTSNLIGPNVNVIGQNLEVLTSVSLSGNAPSNLEVTLTSSDSTKLAFACQPNTSNACSGGGGTITVEIEQNSQQSVQFYAEGFVGSGTVPYTVSAPGGYTTLNLSMPMAPSGFVVTGGGGTSSFSLPLTGAATITVSTAAFVNGVPTLEPVAASQSISVNVTSANVTSGTPSVGSISTSPIVIAGGASSATTNFVPANPGMSTITASQTGYTSGSATATVTASSMYIDPPSRPVGHFLEDTNTLHFVPAITSQETVTISVDQGSNLLLAANPTDPGQTTITVTLCGSGSPCPVLDIMYYVYAQATSGTATYTATSPVHGTAHGSVSLAPSGVIIQGPSGCVSTYCGNISITGAAQNPALGSLTVSTYYLNQDGTVAADGDFEQLAGNAGNVPLTVLLTNSNPTAGTLPGEMGSAASVTVAPGTPSTSFLFTPVTSGMSTTVGVTTPTGWTTAGPFNGTLNLTSITLPVVP